MMYAYLKMDASERQDVKDTFKMPSFIFTIGFVTLGFFLAMLGNALKVKLLTCFGVGTLVIGGIVSTITMWQDKEKLRSIMIIFMLTVACIVLLI